MTSISWRNHRNSSTVWRKQVNPYCSCEYRASGFTVEQAA